MDLLPSKYSEFNTKEYWDSFYQKSTRFEWYGRLSDFSALLYKYLGAKTAKILMIGCGNSSLSCDLYQAGYKNITNIDISDEVVEQMKQQNTDKPEMEWLCMDMLNMAFENATFDVVLDKGTLDALYSEQTAECGAMVIKMFKELGRVTKPMGKYVLISLFQEHIIRAVNEFIIGQDNYLSEIQEFIIRSEESKYFPFISCFTKMKDVGQAKPTAKAVMKMKGWEKSTAVPTSEIVEKVLESQRLGQFLDKTNKLRAGQRIELNCWDANSNTEIPKYTLFVVDAHDKDLLVQRTCAAIICPVGKEHTYYYKTEEGNQELLETAKVSRLVVVLRNKGHNHGELNMVQEEVSGKVLQVRPPKCKTDPIPFMMIEEDTGEQSTLLVKGETVIVETIHKDKYLRQMVFAQNTYEIQSEALIHVVKEESTFKKDTELKSLLPSPTNYVVRVDQSWLSFEFHRLMVLGLVLRVDQIAEKTFQNVVVLGLGGGSLPAFLNASFPSMNIDAVELSQDVIDAAEACFDLQPSDSLKVFCKDALNYLNDLHTAIEEESTSKVDDNEEGEEEEKKVETKPVADNLRKDLIIIDINNPDSAAHFAPPPSFLEVAMLQKIYNCLAVGGILMINFICRQKDRRTEVINKLKQFFGIIYSAECEEDGNTVLYLIKTALSNTMQDISSLKDCEEFSSELLDKKTIENNLKQLTQHSALKWSSEMNMEELMPNFKLIHPNALNMQLKQEFFMTNSTKNTRTKNKKNNRNKKR